MSRPTEYTLSYRQNNVNPCVPGNDRDLPTPFCRDFFVESQVHTLSFGCPGPRFSVQCRDFGHIHEIVSQVSRRRGAKADDILTRFCRKRKPPSILSLPEQHGSYCHAVPVPRTKKIRVSVDRSQMRGRPPFVSRGRHKRRSVKRDQSSSGMSAFSVAPVRLRRDCLNSGHDRGGIRGESDR